MSLEQVLASRWNPAHDAKYGPAKTALLRTLDINDALRGHPVVEVFAGILGSTLPSPDGNEQGVYASYVNVALAAMTSGRQLSCTYVSRDKNRITGLTILE